MLGLKSRTTVFRYLSGEHKPSREVMVRINQISGGLVREEDFDDPTPPRCMKVVMDHLGRRKLVFPWTRYEERLSHDAPRRPRTARQRRWQGVQPPPKFSRIETGERLDEWPSSPVRRGMAVLGDRVKLTKRGGVLLDGRISDLRRVMTAANEELRRRGEPPIPYPGVEPLL